MIRYFKIELKDSTYLDIEHEDEFLNTGEKITSPNVVATFVGSSRLMVPALNMAQHLAQQAMHEITKNYLMPGDDGKDGYIGRGFTLSLSALDDHNYELLIQSHMRSLEVYTVDSEERQQYEADFNELITTLRGE